MVTGFQCIFSIVNSRNLYPYFIPLIILGTGNMHTGIKTWPTFSGSFLLWMCMAKKNKLRKHRVCPAAVEAVMVGWCFGRTMYTLSLFERKQAACCAHYGLLGLFANPSHGSSVCFSAWKFYRGETPLSTLLHCRYISASRLCLSLPTATVRGMQQHSTLVPHQSQSLAPGSWVYVAA